MLPPGPPGFWLGGAKPPKTLPLNGRPQHLIEAAKLGRLDQMLFFPAPLTTRAPPTTVRRPDARPDVRSDVAFQETCFLESTFDIRFREKQLTVCLQSVADVTVITASNAQGGVLEVLNFSGQTL